MYRSNVHHNDWSLDKCVIYFSKDSGLWVAHGVTTDQLGTGDSVLDACVSYLRNIKTLLNARKQDDSIAVHRNAPNRIQVMQEVAIPVPKEITDIATKIVNGKWPHELTCDITSPDSSVYGFELEGSQVEK